MRYLLPIVLLGISISGPACASSFVPLQRAGQPVSPSIIYFGEPDRSEAASSEPDATRAPSSDSIVAISPSIVAVGEPDVTMEFGQVASIGADEKPQRDPRLPPMVIRGGIFGDPFARSGEGPAAVEEAPQQEVTSTPSEPERAAEPRQPEPAQQRPAAPVRQME